IAFTDCSCARGGSFKARWHLNERQFVLRLRDHMKEGRQRNVEQSKHRYLDGVSFWKDQFERAEGARHELQARIVHLERDKVLLEQRAATITSLTPSAATGKRKRDLTKDSMSKTSKRSRPGKDSTSDGLSVQVQDTFSEDFEALNEVGEGKQHESLDSFCTHILIAVGTSLVQSLYSLFKLYKEHNPDSDALCFHLVQTSRAIGSVISAICKRHQTLPIPTPLQTKASAELVSVIRASARAFTSFLLGLSKLSQDATKEQVLGLVIYECVNMFRTLLNIITESALTSAKCTAELAAATASQSASGKGRAKLAKFPKPAKEQNVTRTVSQFLNAIISFLDSSDLLHRELFEGFMFVLLERVGKRLFVCTFDRERSATIEGDISPPLNLGAPAAGPNRELEMKALRLEAPCLVAMLERAMNLAPKYISAPATNTSKNRKSFSAQVKQNASARSLTTGGKMSLSMHGKERLQQTLIDCMFGADEQDGFSDSLRMPLRLGSLPAPPKVEEKDVNDWFKQEVWRVVGWELLGREGDW
ncbi:hypothetical protein K432DRAFT_461936, partial [Lepidopterella palustris CBS 459.81]